MRPDDVKAAHRPRWTGLARLLLLSGAASCMPGAGGGTAGPAPFSCAEVQRPTTLPSAAEVVDVAALVPTVRQLARSAGPVQGQVLLSLEFDAQGVNVRRDVIEHTLTPLLADSVQRLVFAARRQVPAGDAPWGVRLRMTLADSVALGVERRVYCPPRPRNRELEWQVRESEMSGTPGLRYRGGRRERTVMMRLLVHPAGYVENATVYRGGASGGDLERNLFNFVRQYSFHPATLDGVPVPGELVVPVRVTQ